MPHELPDIPALLQDAPSETALARFRGKHVTSRSSDVRPGSIFVALRGQTVDGHSFVLDAAERNASCAVVETPVPETRLPQFTVANTRIALSRLVAASYGFPSDRLFTVAVTGTNGKTTTHWIVAHLLSALGEKSMRIGTLGSVLPDGHVLGELLTTPDSEELQHALATAVQADCSAAVMEASSHALDQFRLDDVSLNVAIFTNLTRDHLDYHGTFEKYAAAKGRIFFLLARSKKSPRRVIINLDDSFGRDFAEMWAGRGIPLVTFGREGDAEIRLLPTESTPAGSIVKFEWRGSMYNINSPYIGEHNAENLVSAIAAVEAKGFSMEDIARAVLRLPQVPGRLEAVGDAELPIFIDYAHTPDALQRVLIALRPLVKGRLWVVFGCGGDRDRGKRPIMGEVASRYADEVVVTSDNPRTEIPDAIISEICLGASSRAVREPDRRAAIRLAIRGAQPGDVVLIAGKGHEPYQIVGRQRLPFSDAAEARNFLAEIRNGGGECSTCFG